MGLVAKMGNGNAQVVCFDFLGTARGGDAGCFVDDQLKEEFERFGCENVLFVCLLGTRGTKKRDETDVQITIGVACATFPTSSSFCIIFLMRACMFVCMHINWHVAKLIRESLER